jgi:hypothetical protein
MARKYSAQAMGKIAQETALKVGCQAVQWWQEEGEPGCLYITAKPILLPHQALVVQLKASLPLQSESTTSKTD